MLAGSFFAKAILRKPCCSLFRISRILSMVACVRTMATSAPSQSPPDAASGFVNPAYRSYPELKLPEDPSLVPKYENSDNDERLVLSVPAVMNYVAPDTQVAHIRRDTAGSDAPIEDARWSHEHVTVLNARSRPYTLDENGFDLVIDSEIENDDGRPIDFLDSDDVLQRYYPSCEALLEKKLGGRCTVRAFDHNIRISGGASTELKNGGGSKTQTPIGLVHGDYTAVSAPKRLQDLARPPKMNDTLRRKLGDRPLLEDATMVEEAVQGKRRFAIVNVWRSIDRDSPVQQLPLAVMDAKTLSGERHVRTLQVHYDDRVGENYLVIPSVKHQWLFYPEMKHTEALLLKTWDSLGGKQKPDGSNIGAFCAHSAFMDPTTIANAPARQSIEVRCIVIWDNADR